MSVKFGGDVSGLQSAAGAAKGILSDLGSGNFAGAAVGTLAGLAGAAIGVGVASTKMAGDFEAGLTSLVTGAGEARSNIKMVGDGIKSLAVSTGTSTKQLTDGMYMIESSGYHGAAGLNVLKVAAQGAKVGNADLGTTANALTTILTDYHMSADQSANAMNGLTATVQSGKTNLQALGGSMGSILPLASSLGVSFPQVAGAIATMTNSGMNAQRASSNLANAVRNLAAPGGAATKALKSVGVSAQELKDTLTNQGLAAAIQLVENHVGKTFPAGSVDAVNAFKKIMGGATGYNVALMLGGKNMSTFEGNVKSIAGAMKGGSGAVMGWSDVQKTFNFKMDQAKQSLNVLMITIGQQLLPVISNIVGAVAPVISKFADWIATSNIVPKSIAGVKTAIETASNVIKNTIAVIQAIHDWFVKWQTPITIVAGVITAFFLPAMIAAGVQAAISGAKIAGSFIASMVQSGVQSVVSAAKVTASFVASMVKAGIEAWTSGGKIVGSFVASMVTTGTQAVVSAAKVTASFVASMVQAGAKAVWAAAQIAGSFILSLIRTAAQAVITGATFLASLIPAIISFVAQSLVAAATAIPAMLVGFGAWVVGALSAAAATLAATWPILLIIAAVALLVVGIVLLVQHWGQVVSFMQGIWQSFTSWLVGALNNIKNFFIMIWNGILSFLKMVGQVLLAILIGPIGLLIIYIITHFTQVKEFIRTIFFAVLSIIQSVWHNIGTSVSNAILYLWNIINNFFGGMPAKMLQFGVNMIQGLINGIMSMAGNIAGAIGSLFSGLGSSVHNALHGAGIPGFASGVSNFRGGWAVVGENGPELVKLPGGSNVYPNGTMPSGGHSGGNNGASGGNQYITIELDGHKLTQVVSDRQARNVRLKQGRRIA